MSVTAPRIVDPGGGTHDGVERHADGFQKGDEPTMMLAGVADAAPGQDGDGRVSRRGRVTLVVRSSLRLETRSPAPVPEAAEQVCRSSNTTSQPARRKTSTVLVPTEGHN